MRDKSRFSILCRPGKAHVVEKQGLANAMIRMPMKGGAEAKADFAERMVTIMLSRRIFELADVVFECIDVEDHVCSGVYYAAPSAEAMLSGMNTLWQSPCWRSAKSN